MNTQIRTAYAVIGLLLSIGSVSAQTYSFKKPMLGIKTEASLSATPSLVAFADTIVGNSAQSSVQISNTGNATAYITGLNTDNPTVFPSTHNCGLTLVEGQSCTVSISFIPTSVGTVTGSLLLPLATGLGSISLTGTGIPSNPVVTSSGSVVAGNVVVGNTWAGTITLSNMSGLPYTVSGLSTIPGYTFAHNCTSIAAGNTCAITVTFNPVAEIDYSGTLVVDGNTSSPLSIPVSGFGVAPPNMVATGGIITYAGGYTIHTFKFNGTFTVTTGGNVEILSVAGGGGASFNYGGGGGAGGLVHRTGVAMPNGTYTIVVGAGGAAGYESNPTRHTNGGNSSVVSSLGIRVVPDAIGGGRGGNYNSASASSGGSGGGGGGLGNGAGGAGTTGQGNAGGTGYSGGHGGGGGGAGGAGASTSSYSGGSGGNGLLLDISGTPTYYAGGGGGGGPNSGGNGGMGGGGKGSYTPNISGSAGVPNTGGGGGGGAGGNSGGSGGSGIVIIRYPT